MLQHWNFAQCQDVHMFGPLMLYTFLNSHWNLINEYFATFEKKKQEKTNSIQMH